jgi:glycosyltransferase involved in cell wall biosynthesis
MIGLSLLTLVPGRSGAGAETFARGLCRALSRYGTLEYRAFVPKIAPDAGEGLDSRVVTSYPAAFSIPGRALAMLRAAVAPGEIRRQLEPEKLSAIHFPLSVMLPLVPTPPAAVTIHDVLHEVHPRLFSRAELAYRQLAHGASLRTAKVVLTSSRFSEDALVERLGVPREKVRVVPLAVDLERFAAGEDPREPFLLYPANRWRHKNHERLFEALRLIRRVRPETTLVLTGAGHERRRVPEGVVARGWVGVDELVRLYRTASALVFPSLYEGFGLPVLEAMACGCPVAASNVASLPEVCGDAARLFDPTVPEAIAKGVLDLLEEPRDCVQKGLSRVKEFTWKACVERHEAVYRELPV